MQTQHLTNEEIEQLFSGDNFEQSQAKQHLNTCQGCQELAESMAASPWWWNEGRELVVSAIELAEVHGKAPEPPSSNGKRSSNDADVTTLISSFGSARHPELLGRVDGYDVHSLIGVGGMGAVFRGFDSELNRPVAIKFLLPTQLQSGLARQRFAREAKAIAAVRDDSVVAVFRINSTAAFPYFTMPYVAGISLQEYVELEGMLDPEHLIQIAIQIASGLQAAHEKGLVHRDVKPANILLENNCNRVVVTDFGLAREESDLGLTQTGMVAGTPRYMSPEQAEGKQVDQRSDLFSLGSVMYYMATGRVAFDGVNQFEVLNNIRRQKPDSLRKQNPAVPPRLQQAIERLLAKDPAKRFRNAAEVKEFLVRLLAHLKSPESNVAPRLSLRLPSVRKMAGIAVASILCVIFLTSIPGISDSLSAFANHDNYALPGIIQETVIEPIPIESKEMDSYFADRRNAPIVRGHLVNFTRNDLSEIVIEYVLQVPSKLQETRIANVNRNGQFTIDVTYPFPCQEVMLRITESSNDSRVSEPNVLFFGSLMVHKALTIEVDLPELRKNENNYDGDGITFSGSDASMCEYLRTYRKLCIKKLRAVWNERTTIQAQDASSTEAAVTKLKASFAEERKILDRFISANPSEHAWILKEDIESNYHGEVLLPYLTSRSPVPEELWQTSLTHSPKTISSHSTGYYHNLNLLAGQYNNVELWRSVLNEKVTTPEDQDDVEEFLESFEKLGSRSANPKHVEIFKEGKRNYFDPNLDAMTERILELHVAKLKKLDRRKANVVMVLGAAAASSPQKYVEEIRPMLQEGWCKTVFDEEHQKDLAHANEVQDSIKRAMAEGADRLGQKMMSSGGSHMYYGNQKDADQVAESLAKSFQGKAIIVDFWSLSCGACIHDMVNSREKKAALAKLPVEIVYICLDSQYEMWMETVISKGIKGNHLFLDKELSAKVSEHFKINSQPSFIFIDADGNYDRDLIRFLANCDIKAIESKLKSSNKK